MTIDPNAVHVDFYVKADGIEFAGKSADGVYQISGFHILDKEGAIRNVQQGIAEHNTQTGSAYTFATYTFH